MIRAERLSRSFAARRAVYELNFELEAGAVVAFVGPNLVAYDDAVMTAVLQDGKKANIGIMPSFKGRLNPTQEKAVAAYIRSLGE